MQDKEQIIKCDKIVKVNDNGQLYITNDEDKEVDIY